MCMLVARVVSLSDQTQLGGGGNDAVKNTNTNEIQIFFLRDTTSPRNLETDFCSPI
jgi:hypothetical protein